MRDFSGNKTIEELVKYDMVLVDGRENYGQEYLIFLENNMIGGTKTFGNRIPTQYLYVQYHIPETT